MYGAFVSGENNSSIDEPAYPDFHANKMRMWMRCGIVREIGWKKMWSVESVRGVFTLSLQRGGGGGVSEADPWIVTD